MVDWLNCTVYNNVKGTNGHPQKMRKGATEQMLQIDLKKLKIEMARAVMSVRELAKAAGAAPSSIQRLMRTGRAQHKTVGKLARALGVDVTEIIASTDERR